MTKFSIKNREGFTLVETISTIAIFGTIMLIFGGVFMNSLFMQRKAFNLQQVSENTNFIMESMAKEIRVGQIATLNSNCPVTPSQTLTIVHPVEGQIIYSLQNGDIHKAVEGQDSIINSNKVKFSRFQFCVSGNSGVLNDGKQPKVTVLGRVDRTGIPSSNALDFETTISQRTLSN